MNNQFFNNKSNQINNTNDYCQLLKIQNDLKKMFDDQIAALQARISKLGGAPSPGGSLSSVIAFANWVYNEIQTLLAAVQDAYALLLSEQAKLIKQLNDKITALEAALLKKTPKLDLSKFCSSTASPNRAVAATEATPKGDRNTTTS